MALLPILRFPDPRLKKVAAPVSKVTDQIRKLAADMAETMYAAPGVGLAATQVDVHLQILVADVSETHNQLMVLINPVIESRDGDQEGEEGCLSVPGLRGLVPRWRSLRYTGFDPHGTPITREVEGFHARVVQHECDHLDGILYPSRIRDFRCFGFAEELFPDAALAPDD